MYVEYFVMLSIWCLFFIIFNIAVHLTSILSAASLYPFINGDWFLASLAISSLSASFSICEKLIVIFVTFVVTY